MANYKSIAARFNPARSRINHERISHIIRDKQNTIDTNFGIMSETVDKVLGVDFANTEDAEMLKDKVSDVLGTLDNTDAIDFTSKKSRFLVQNALHKVSRDPEVLREIANTKKIRAYQAAAQKAMEEGTYSQENDMYSRAVSGLGDYMKSSKEGRNKNLGSLNYTPYHDYKKEGFDTFNSIQKNLNAEVTKLVPDENTLGGFREVTYRPLSSNQVKQMVYNQLSSKAKLQMGIEGSAIFGFSTERARETLEGKVATLTAEKKDKNEKLTYRITNGTGLSPNQISSLEKKIQDNNDYYDSKIDAYSSMTTKSALEIGSENRAEEFLDFLIPSDYGKPRVTGVEADQAYFKTLEIQSKFEEAKRKAEKEKAEKEKGLGITVKEDYTPIEKEKEKLIDLEYQNMMFSKDKANQLASDIYNGNTDTPITAEQRKEIDEIEQEYKKELIKEGVNIKDDFVFNKEVYKRAVNSGVIEPDEHYSEALDKAEAKVRTYDKRYNEAVSLWQESKAEQAYEQILNSDDIEIVSENGVNSNLKQRLEKEGVTSSKEFLKFLNSDKGNTVKANLMLGSLGRKGFNALHAHMSGEAVSRDYSGALLRERFDDMIANIDKVKKTLGIEGDISQHISFPKEGPLHYVDDYGRNRSRVVFNPESPLTKFLKKSSENEGGLSEFHFSRQTPEDASSVKEMFDVEDNDDFRDFRVDLYKGNKIRHRGNNMIIVQKNTPTYEELADDPFINIPDNHKRGLFLRQGKGDTFDVYIKKTVEVGGEDGLKKEKTEVMSFAGNINKSRIQDQTFRDKIDYEEDIELLDYGVEYKTTSYAPRYEDSPFSSQNLKLREDLKKFYPQKEWGSLGAEGTKKGLNKVLSNVTKTLEGIPEISKERIQQAKTLSNFYQKNYNNFRLRLTGDSSSKHIELIYQDSDTRTPISVSSNPIGNVDPNVFRKKYYKYPQLYMTGLIEKAVKLHDPDETFTGTSKLLNHLKRQ